MMGGTLQTVFGWQYHPNGDLNPRTLLNWPMQGNGSEMMRLACIYGTEAGVEICCPVHDAAMICAPVDRIEADFELMRRCMIKASADVLGGFELKVEGKLIVYPDRYMDDKRGAVMWQRVVELTARAQTRAELKSATMKARA
jgi:DNA polymerase-1